MVYAQGGGVPGSGADRGIIQQHPLNTDYWDNAFAGTLPPSNRDPYQLQYGAQGGMTPQVQPGSQTLGGMAQQPLGIWGGPNNTPEPWQQAQFGTESWRNSGRPAGGMSDQSGPSQPQQGGSLTFQQANDPTYIRQQLKAAMTKRAQASGQPPPTAADVEQNMHYITQPDTYRDGQVHSGWSPYWEDKFGTPGREGGSGADLGDSSTLVPGGGGQIGAGGGFSPNAH